LAKKKKRPPYLSLIRMEGIVESLLSLVTDWFFMTPSLKGISVFPIKKTKRRERVLRS